MLLALTKGKIIAAIVFSFFLLCVALPGVAQNLDLETAKRPMRIMHMIVL